MIVSACLVGCACRYDGKSVPDPLLKAMFEAGDLVPVCPEVLGGLATPRDPAEIVSQDPLLICTEAGIEVTDEFRKGANQAVGVAQAIGARQAILKSKSPSCGSSRIYDGSFRGKLIPGEGIASRAMRAAGIEVMNEEEAKGRFLSACTRILVLRHAKSVFSSDDRGRGLSDDGVEAARILADQFPSKQIVDQIYSSPYRRAIDTAKPLMEKWKMEMILDERLRERKVAAKPVEDFDSFAKRQWLDHAFSLPEGESLEDVAERGREAVLEMERKHRGKTILFSTHGTWMGAVFQAFDSEFHYSDWEDLQMPDLWEMVLYKGNLVNLNRMTKE